MNNTSKIYILPAVMMGVTAVAGIAASVPGANAENISPVDDTVTITVDSSCTMGIISRSSMTGIIPGETKNIGTYNMAAYCNDSNGYDIYAIGYTNGEYGNTNMISTNGNTIHTGTSGEDSYWNMRLTPGTATDPVTHIPTIVSPFTNNTNIPSDYTKVVTYPSTTIPQGEDPMVSGSYFGASYDAHASVTQPAGTYTGQVQYVMVHPSGAAKPEKPNIGQLTYMQDLARLSEQEKASIISNTRVEVAYTLKDERDGQEYTVAKLKDGKIWMTKNLNLAGGTEITSELSNVPDGYTLPTANGFQSGNKLPASSTSGFNEDTKAFVYNSTKTSGADCTSPGCYSYYSWTASTAGSGLSITADDTDAPYSICPKGWKLPSTRTTSVADWKTKSDFYKLAVAYGMDPSSISQSTTNFFSQAGPGTTPNFLLAGFYLNGSFNEGGRIGVYWPSTSCTSTYARYLYFNSSNVNSASGRSRGSGLAVRCVAE